VGDLPIAEAIRTGKLHLDGPADLARPFRTWLKLSIFSGIERAEAEAV
jgi:hypothetical protein